MKKIQQYGTGISLILLDIVMLGMDGFDVLNFLNKTGIIDDIPVILISSENSDEMVDTGLRNGNFGLYIAAV